MFVCLVHKKKHTKKEEEKDGEKKTDTNIIFKCLWFFVVGYWNEARIFWKMTKTKMINKVFSFNFMIMIQVICIDK